VRYMDKWWIAVNKYYNCLGDGARDGESGKFL